MNFHLSSLGEVLAPAKVNLHLQVTGLLPDGRHTLETSFAFVDVYDTLYVQRAGELTVDCSVEALSGEANLVYRVLQALREKYRVQQGLRVFIEKRLPAEAGLGGGSSDAASALLAANEVWQLNLTQDQLIGFSAPFGADIPCFLFARASVAHGVGEKLSVYTDSFPGSYVCLARPKHGLSTKAVFQHFDRQQERTLTMRRCADKVRPASQGYVPIGSNDLEVSAIALLPDVAMMLRAMRCQVSDAWMSGSGSTCLALCSSKSEAGLLAQRLQDDGLASWTHAGELLDTHPAFAANIGA